MFIYRIKMYMLLRIKCCIKILLIYSDITLFQVGFVLLIFKCFFLVLSYYVYLRSELCVVMFS